MVLLAWIRHITVLSIVLVDCNGCYILTAVLVGVLNGGLEM
jgi:hypothetical protein